MRHPLTQLIALLVALLVVLAGSYFLTQQDGPEPTVCYQATGLCDQKSEVTLTFDGPIVVNQPLLLRLSLPATDGPAIAQLNVRLTGKDMYMGITETTLSRHEDAYEGILRIPICTTEQMVWQMTVSLPQEATNKVAFEPLFYQFTITQS